MGVHACVTVGLYGAGVADEASRDHRGELLVGVEALRELVELVLGERDARPHQFPPACRRQRRT